MKSAALKRANERIREMTDSYTDSCEETFDLLTALVYVSETTTDQETKSYVELILSDYKVTEH